MKEQYSGNFASRKLAQAIYYPQWNSLHGGVWIFSGTTCYDNDNDIFMIFFLLLLL